MTTPTLKEMLSQTREYEQVAREVLQTLDLLPESDPAVCSLYDITRTLTLSDAKLFRQVGCPNLATIIERSHRRSLA
jgi:hypothetical protein